MSLEKKIKELKESELEKHVIHKIIKDEIKIRDDKLVEYLDDRISNFEEAKAWINNWANDNNQTIQDGEYKGLMLTVNYMIRLISISLGENVENAFESKYYWDLRDSYEKNIKL